MASYISNSEFLSRYPADEFANAILPQEKALIEKRLSQLAEAHQEIIAEKIAVSGGDDWHDGAFRATDNEAKIISEQAARLDAYLSSAVVDFPGSDERQATLGSRVTLNQSGDVYDVEIVGIPFLHETAGLDDVIPCSLESPIAKGIIGKEVGHTALLRIAGRNNSVELLSIDQEAMKMYLNDEMDKK